MRIKTEAEQEQIEVADGVYQVGEVAVDSGRIQIGDCGSYLSIRTCIGDGLYPVYVNDIGQIIIDVSPWLDMKFPQELIEKRWAEGNHDCTQIEL